MEDKRSLLEIAQSADQNRNVKRIIDPEIVELAIAWAKGEITLSQSRIALKLDQNDSATVYCLYARALREALHQGLLVKKGK